jgi:AAA domain-containing protein
MPSAAAHKSSTYVKLLYIGDSGTGKTTSLASLVEAGYQLRVLDFDNLLDPLVHTVRRSKAADLSAIEYMTFRDRLRTTPNGPIIDGVPTAYIGAMKAIDRWEDGTTPSDWGATHILVIDSLTTMSRSAYWWAKGLLGAATFAEGVPIRGVRPEQFYHTAQQAIMNTIAYVTAESFNANVIVIAHVKYMERDGQTKGFPVAVGNAISPEIPSYFPSVALATKSGTRRTIRTRSTNMIDLKNPRSFDMAEELDMEDGLARFFKAALS